MDEKKLPKYKCTKEVWALKITKLYPTKTCENCESDGSYMFESENSGFEPIKLNAEYMRKHKPQVGGYYVVYADGYESWSPAEAFESGYTLID